MNPARQFKVIIIAALTVSLISPMVMAQENEAKKQRKQVIVKDGQVYFSEDGIPFGMHHGSLLSRTYIGVNLLTLSPELKTHFGAKAESGTMISKVAPESPAAQAGLRVGDVITSVNGQKVAGPGDVMRAIREKKGGESVRVDFVRGGVPQHVFITVAERENVRVDRNSLITPEMMKARGLAIESAEKIGEYFKSPEWKARVEKLQDCGRVQGRVHELEARLKELEKRLEK